MFAASPTSTSFGHPGLVEKCAAAERGASGARSPPWTSSARVAIETQRSMTLLVPFDRPVIRGRLLRRYKRFFVDVAFENGAIVVAHTSNTGAMTGLVVANAPVLLTVHDTKTRTIPYELEAVFVDDAWVSVNTNAANAFASRAIEL